MFKIQRDAIWCAMYIYIYNTLNLFVYIYRYTYIIRHYTPHNVNICIYIYTSMYFMYVYIYICIHIHNTYRLIWYIHGYSWAFHKLDPHLAAHEVSFAFCWSFRQQAWIVGWIYSFGSSTTSGDFDYHDGN